MTSSWREVGAGRMPADIRSGRGGRVLAVLALGLLAACSSTAPEVPPGAPGAVTAVTASEQGITVAWALPTAEVTTIELERSQNGGPFTPLTILTGDVTSHTDTDLAPGTTYRYRLRACNVGGCSPFSAEASTTTSGALNGLAVRTTLLPPGVAGLPYGPALSASGGSGAPITWTVESGTLPPGVTLEPGGGFSGLPTATGTFTFTVGVQGYESTHATFSVHIAPSDDSRFNITRFDVVPVPVAAEPHVLAAITRWESVIVGNLSEDSIPRGFFRSRHCAGFGGDINCGAVDDVLIVVNVDSIDGQGGGLAQAGPCGLRDDGLPVVGVLTLDRDDMESHIGSQQLTDIVFHEIGHILGFGPLWGGVSCTPGATNCFDYLQGEGGSAPIFTGPEAVREWHALGGSGGVPIENSGGPGTALSHWSEATFGAEIMTGFIEREGIPAPLSRLTIASFSDLGYEVSHAGADSYALRRAPSLRDASGEDVSWELPLSGPVRTLPRR